MLKLDKKLLEENITKRLTEDIESGRVGGASVIVKQEGQVVYKNCFGFKRIEEKEPLTEEAIFRLASMTKPVTAVAVLMQIERGKLSLDMPVSKLLPGFENMKVARGEDGFEIIGDAKKQITVEDLLSHKSGLACMEAGNYQTAKMTAADKENLKSVVNFYENMALDFEPDSMERYSPVAAFDVLARLVEITSDMPFAEFVRKNISDPMELADFTLTPNDAQRERFIDMHNMIDGKSINTHMPKENIFADFMPSYTCGGAGCTASITDYSDFAEMLLNGGKSGNVRIISEEMIKQMQIPRPPHANVPRGENWGLGVRVNKNGFYKRIPEGSFGWSGAYGTHFWVDPSNKITAVYMKNSIYDGGSGAVTAANFEEDVNTALK